MTVIYKPHLVRVFHSAECGGSPAGVLITNRSVPAAHLIQLTKKLKVPDTAWVWQKDGHNQIRFFTPSREIQFCGHATLAAGLICSHKNSGIIKFKSRIGKLEVKPERAAAEMKSLRQTARTIKTPSAYLKEARWFSGGEDYIAVLESEEAVKKFKPKFRLIRSLKRRGLVITASDAPGKYALRFFAPQCGIPEDPCTGSVQSVLADLWRRQNKQTAFDVVQLSDSGGFMRVVCGTKFVRVRGQVQRVGRPEVSVK